MSDRNPRTGLVLWCLNPAAMNILRHSCSSRSLPGVVTIMFRSNVTWARNIMSLAGDPTTVSMMITFPPDGFSERIAFLH